MSGKKNTKLRAYMVSGDDPSESAILVFAHTAREAKYLGAPYVMDWSIDAKWIDVCVTWLKGRDFLFVQADQDKLKNGESHIIEWPQLCVSCQMWGYELDENGRCESCRECVDNE